MLYAQVILPRPIDTTFTYKVPSDMEGRIGVGMRVIVPFGNKHFYTGVVQGLSPFAPEGGFQMKEIEILPDVSSVVTPLQMRFWEWMAEYYLCSIGEVFQAALPSGLKVESETQVEICADVEPESLAILSDEEIELVDYLSREGKTPVKVLAKKLDIPKVEAVVTRLMGRGILVVSEKIQERYRSAKKTYVRPTIERNNAEAMEAAFKAVKRSRRQEDLLVGLLAMSEFHRQGVPVVEVPIEALCEKTGATRELVRALRDKGLCEIFTRDVSRFSYSGAVVAQLPSLSPAQNNAYEEIHQSFRNNDIVLLHGVTSSGKTEIYIHLIDYVLRQGKQTLFMVPEIALTTQLTRRLQRVFGDKVLIYHSKFTDNERVEIWQRMMRSTDPVVVIGARSSIFLPYSQLGLVIVDEEHEPSYKQYDPAPRYNGRDAATVLASMHGAKTLFGSATPTIETYYKATTGKFGLVTLSERFGGATLPPIEVVDMQYERRQKRVAGYFSERLSEVAASAMNKGKQVIFFHNRRGYSPQVVCKQCAYIPRCKFCDVALTYHRRTNRMQCHYCGAEYIVPQTCPVCHEPALEISGYGTERLEEEIESRFSGRKILRMDLDTTRNKDDYAHIIDDFSHHKADILVGTQMVTKGLDFSDVEVVGVLNVDMLLNIPDFRSTERAFNMVEQVSGRAGRRQDIGKVLVQSYSVDHPILPFIQAHDYLGFYHSELRERQAFNFPPFCRIVSIYLKHRDERTLVSCVEKYHARMKEIFGSRISGVQIPPVARVSSLYIRKLMLKVELGASMKGVKNILRQEFISLSSAPTMHGLVVYYDVDPV